MPGLYSITTRAFGETIDAAKYNADHQAHVDGTTSEMTDDYSASVAQMQSAVDPGERGSESLPTSMAGELERLRATLAEIKATTYWYESARVSLSDAVGGMCGVWR